MSNCLILNNYTNALPNPLHAAPPRIQIVIDTHIAPLQTSSASTNQMEPSTLRQLQQLQHLLSRQSGASADEPTAGTSGVLPGAPPSGSSALLATTTTSSSSGGSSNAPVSHQHSAAAGHFASKQLLDFEYGGAAGHDNLHHHNQMDDGATMLLGHGNSDVILLVCFRFYC